MHTLKGQKFKKKKKKKNERVDKGYTTITETIK